MAVVVIAEIPGADAASDARFQQEVGLGQNVPAPAGAIARFAGPTESGYRVITVWDTEEHFLTFRRERMQPAFERMSAPPITFQIAALDTYNISQR